MQNSRELGLLLYKPDCFSKSGFGEFDLGFPACVDPLVDLRWNRFRRCAASASIVMASLAKAHGGLTAAVGGGPIEPHGTTAAQQQHRPDPGPGGR